MDLCLRRKVLRGDRGYKSGMYNPEKIKKPENLSYPIGPSVNFFVIVVIIENVHNL